ncbi:hypothetical protein QQS21_002294 [Conoideocrella luteorostrata]|uniref:ABC transporter n=1 Tax=Conoideocrella luteorostrata TaxID=1105319 RepID=A0AAJ0FWR5_9HYPO|nr:hypothetical protein QQS21_002294 [Conoideocrella luteorostrata]
MNYRLVTRARGVLVSEILEQTLLIDHVQAMEFAAATLMSTDVDGIATGIPQFHEIWASSVEAIVGVVILAKMIGAATCLIVFPGLIMTITSTITGKRMAPSRAAWNKQVESRVATTSIILRQIQGIRMTGLAPFATDLLQGLRVSEMKYSIKFRQLWVCLRAFVMLCGHMTPMIIVAAALFWTKFTNGIDAVEIFAALAFIFNTSQAMIRIMVAYPGFRSIMGCLHRIQTYLLLPRRLDGRETISDLVLRNCESTISEKDASKSLSPPERKPRIELQLPQPPVVLIDVSVAPTVTDAAILNNVNISVARSEIAAVVGHTGSGKSTLLKAIIGEAHVFEGLVYVEQRSIAFCDQSSWLRNVSMKENIIGQSNYDEDWYNVVIEACLLSDDIQQLPNGDETMVGNGGSSLSGGQRQRVALARAIYCQTPILVLDNVFSALDEASADSIFDGLFGSLGLLRRINSTVIMTTHSVKYLQMVDQLIVINEDGSVKTVPNSIKEVANKSQIRNMMVDTSSTEDREQTRRDEGPGKEIGIDCLRTERVELLRRRGDLGLYRYYFTSVAKWLWLVWFVSMIFTTLSEKFPEIFIRIWSERGPTNNLYLVGYMLLGLCNFISSAMSLSLYYFMIVPKSAENLHRKLLDAVMKSTTRFISYTNSGSILNLFSQDMSLLCQELPFSFFLFILSSLMILIDLGIIASGATYAPFVIPGVFLALYAIQHFYLRTSRQLRHVDLETKTPLYSYFTEATAGLMHIRSYGWGTKFLADSRVLLDRSQRPFYSMYCIQRWLGLVLDLCVLGVATILVSVAVCIRHSTSPSALGLAMLNIIQFGDTLGSLLAQWINLETSLGAIARIREFTQNTPFEPETVTNDSLPSTCLRPGSIQLTNVSSTYDSDGSNPALRGVSLDIKAGQKAIVIGRTGCGKSSLILTMLNFLDYTGSIKVDDVDLSQIPRQVLRSCITTIPQDLVELPGTIRQNVIPTRQDASDDAIVTQALDDVGLISYINTRGGIDADLKTMGFSHGQKQLLGIARALLHHKKYDSRILFVDEATSGMDNATADKIDRLLAEVFAGCTVVSISHRVGQATHADLVVEISDGQIVSLREI